MALPTGVYGYWPKDGTLPEIVREFVDWWVTPEWERPDHEKTIIAWCRARDIAESTTKGWRRRPAFKKAVSARCEELNLQPERIQEVIAAVHRAAVRGDVKAAQLYLQHVDKLTPKRIVIEDRTIAGLSDEELRDRIREFVGADDLD